MPIQHTLRTYIPAIALLFFTAGAQAQIAPWAANEVAPTEICQIASPPSECFYDPDSDGTTAASWQRCLNRLRDLYGEDCTLVRVNIQVLAGNDILSGDFLIHLPSGAFTQVK